MKLSDISTSIRLRSPWEAVDLGFALAQRNWRNVYPAWFMLLAMFTLASWLIMPESYKGFVPLLVWWFKPLYDRLLLHIFSHQLFNQPLDSGRIFAALPGLLKNTGLLSALTFRRFSLSRGFNLPLWQLEQLRGKARTERQNLLHLQSHSHAVWLTIACIHLEYVVLFSLYALILLLDPTEGSWDYLSSAFRTSMDVDVQYWGNIIYALIYSLTIFVVEPLYIAASFSLYLNRRTQLEAWDIELAFRNLGARLSERTQASVGAGLLVLLLGGSLLALPSAPVQAATTSHGETLAPQRLPASESRAQIEAVMQQEEFQQARKVRRWEPREKAETPKPRQELAEEIQIILALFFKALLIIAVIVALTLGFIYHRQILAMLKPLQRKQEPPPPPDILFGMDIRPESLPEDIAGESQALWRAGKAREALSLLYRGALMRLTRHQHLPIHDSHTEGDILRLAKSRLGTEPMAWLTATSSIWREIAYAHRIPEDKRVEPLFTGWTRHFVPGTTPSPAGDAT